MIKNLIKKFNVILLLFFTTQIYNKFQRHYQRKFGTKMPVILVGGNVGKSSQTLILNQLYAALGYRVWTGTTMYKNRNTLTGLIMVLGEFNQDLEQSNFTDKFSFLIKAKIAWLFKTWNFGNKPNILIYEVGIDHQNESDLYINLFKQVDWVILSNFGPEHTAGFSNVFDRKSNTNISQQLKGLIEFESDLDLLKAKYEIVEKNCYLEQLKLLTIAKRYILPSTFEISDKTEIVVFDSKLTKIIPKVERKKDFTLEIDDVKTNSEYFLPLSFARQIAISKIIYESNFKDLSTPNNSSSDTKIDLVYYENWSNIVSKLELPNGRFGFFNGLNNSKIVDGSYNNDPASLKTFVNQILKTELNQRNYLIIGEMRELGLNTVTVHNQMLDYIDSLPFKYKKNLKIMLLGDTWKKCNYDKNQIVYFERVGQAITYFKKIKFPANSWFWIKGSQNTIFLEALVESLLVDKKDKSKLARIGKDWDEIRKPYLIS